MLCLLETKLNLIEGIQVLHTSIAAFQFVFCKICIRKNSKYPLNDFKYQHKIQRKLSSQTNLKDLKWLCCSVLLISMHCIYVMYLFMAFFNKDN